MTDCSLLPLQQAVFLQLGFDLMLVDGAVHPAQTDGGLGLAVVVAAAGDQQPAALAGFQKVLRRFRRVVAAESLNAADAGVNNGVKQLIAVLEVVAGVGQDRDAAGMADGLNRAAQGRVMDFRIARFILGIPVPVEVDIGVVAAAAAGPVRLQQLMILVAGILQQGFGEHLAGIDAGRAELFQLFFVQVKAQRIGENQLLLAGGQFLAADIVLNLAEDGLAPVDAVAEHMQIDGPEGAVDLNGGDQAEMVFPGGGFRMRQRADAVVVGDGDDAQAGIPALADQLFR